MLWALDRVAKEKVVAQADKAGGFAGMRKDMVATQYKQNRNNFRKEWGGYIRIKVITDNLAGFFSKS